MTPKEFKEKYKDDKDVFYLDLHYQTIPDYATKGE
jgi:hypothetical protein